MRIANDTEYGLGAGVWTQNAQTAHRAVRAIRSGTVWVNTYSVLDPYCSFQAAASMGSGTDKRAWASMNLHAYLEGEIADDINLE